MQVDGWWWVVGLGEFVGGGMLEAVMGMAGFLLNGRWEGWLMHADVVDALDADARACGRL